MEEIAANMKCAMKRDAPGKYMETEHATTAAI
jgi:hypothetical protein